MGKFSGTTVDASKTFRREAARLEAIGINSRKAVHRASGTLLRRLPAEAKRDIRREYNLKAGRVSKDLRASRVGDGVIELVGYRRPIGLIQYGGRWGGRRTPGATYQIGRGGQRKTMDGTFIVTGLSGNRHIYESYGPPTLMFRGHYAGEMKWQISARYFGSIAGFLVQKGRPDRLAEYADEILRKEFDRIRAGGRL